MERTGRACCWPRRPGILACAGRPLLPCPGAPGWRFLVLASQFSLLCGSGHPTHLGHRSRNRMSCARETGQLLTAGQQAAAVGAQWLSAPRGQARSRLWALQPDGVRPLVSTSGPSRSTLSITPGDKERKPQFLALGNDKARS